MLADLCQKFARDTWQEARVRLISAAMAVWDVAGLPRTFVCVLRQAWDPPLGGTLCGDACGRRTGHFRSLRIGSGSADREKAPAVRSFCQARRLAANTGSAQLRQVRRTSARLNDAEGQLS